MVDGYASIQALSDDVLTRVFSFIRPHWQRPDFSDKTVSSLTWPWHRIAHVCRRWRYLILTSQDRLGVGLVMSGKRKRPWQRGTTLDLWPSLPISMCYTPPPMVFLRDAEDIIATLEHFDRIFDITLTISDPLLARSNAWMESFPVLERLCLYAPHDHSTLPSGFLGGSAVASRKLRYIVLERVIVPTLPQLLSSSRGLIRLYLGKDVLTGEGYLSPAVLTAALSAAVRLELLHIDLPSNILVEQGSTDSGLPPPKLVALPALIHFELRAKGSNEYLEILVSVIHAPLLETICVKISQEDALPSDTSRLSQFISRTERLSSLPFQTSISVEEDKFRVSHEFGSRGHICFKLKCDSEILGVTEVALVCKRLFPLMSDVERVRIEMYVPLPMDETESDMAPWLQLFPLFEGAQELELDSVCRPHEVYESPKMGHEMFPALRILRLSRGFDLQVPQIIMSFVAERELSGRPITVIRTCRRLQSGSKST